MLDFNLPSKRKRGFEYEQRVVDYLVKHDYQILCTNFSCKLGEIDIVAKDKETIVFIEVRYRKLPFFGGAAASVNRAKQKKLIRTAQFYLQQKQLTHKCSCRFDVVAIQGEDTQLQFDWIKNAFSL